MQVICKGYEKCLNKLWCSHAKPHEFDNTTINYCHTNEDIGHFNSNKMCCCNENSIRQMKLNKLKIL